MGFRRFRFFSSTALAVFLFAALLSGARAGAQMLNQDPGHSQFLMLGNAKFSCPKSFACTRSRTEGGAIYIADLKYDLELVVGIVAKDSGSDWPEHLAGAAAGHVFPKERAKYSWKVLSTDDQGTRKSVSKFETGSGGVQGFNGRQRVVLQYRKLKVKDQEVLVGYLFGLGRGEQAKTLFEQNLAGDSMPGWYAQAHIIASLTGEPYSDINPGTSIKAVDVSPPRKP